MLQYFWHHTVQRREHGTENGKQTKPVQRREHRTENGNKQNLYNVGNTAVQMFTALLLWISNMRLRLISSISAIISL